jgi:energy-coupling factor transporter transmembrane protein EcfT
VSRASVARACSPAARILLLVLLTAGVATLRAPSKENLLAATAGLFLLVGLVRPDPSRLFVRALVGLGVVAVFVLPLAVAGSPERAGLLGARSLLALGVALTLADTLALAEVGPALAALGVPCKLASVVAAALTQVGLLRETGERIALARRLRGARGVGVGPDIVAALLVRSAERAERMSLAADLRGRDIRRSARQSRLVPRDALLLAPALVAAVALHLM